MLYPTNIELKQKSKMKKIKEKLVNFKNSIKTAGKYLIFDRSNLRELIIMKFHI